MDIRKSLLLFALLVSTPVGAQIHTAKGPKAKPIPAAPRPVHNSMAKSTTPFNCEQYRWPKHPQPGFKRFCDRIEADTLQTEARRSGRPGPSDDVVGLPALVSPEARRTGVACVGGQAMRKLGNGWEQVSAKEGGWQRCRVSVFLIDVPEKYSEKTLTCKRAIKSPNAIRT